MVEEKTEKKKEESKDNYVMKEVITQTDTGIGKKDDEGVFTEKGLLLEIINKLDRIEKALA